MRCHVLCLRRDAVPLAMPWARGPVISPWWCNLLEDFRVATHGLPTLSRRCYCPSGAAPEQGVLRQMRRGRVGKDVGMSGPGRVWEVWRDARA